MIHSTSCCISYRKIPLQRTELIQSFDNLQFPKGTGPQASTALYAFVKIALLDKMVVLCQMQKRNSLHCFHQIIFQTKGHCCIGLFMSLSALQFCGIMKCYRIIQGWPKKSRIPCSPSNILPGVMVFIYIKTFFIE